MIKFGNRVELMVDRYLIDKMGGCTFRGEALKDEGKIISFTEPWECFGSSTSTAFDDNGTVKLYYRGYPDKTTGLTELEENQVSCLAESADGIHFVKKPVNEIDYFGIKENNIVSMGMHCHNFAPFLDKNPNCKPEEKYKSICGHFKKGVETFASPDGIHWKKTSDDYVITKGFFDTTNIAFFDTVAGKYRCFTRTFLDRQRNIVDVNDRCDIPGAWMRIIQSSESTDFKNWSEPVPHDYGAHKQFEHLYTNATTPIPGAEHILAAFPMRFHAQRKKVYEFNGNPQGSNGISDMVFMTSRDGQHWDRTIREGYLSGNLDETEWTQRNFIASSGIISRDDKFIIYVQKHYMWEDHGIWAYSVPRYRFSAIEAGYDGGILETNDLEFENDDFYINYSTSAYGSIVIKAVDEFGNFIAKTDEIYGNELSHKVHFEGLKGRHGRLIIEMNDAKLYAIGADMSK